jgi:undecaprenyl pyrophosphate phosphatase UppP
VSSSGAFLVLAVPGSTVPIWPPAVLHLGTLAAVLWYYQADLLGSSPNRRRARARRSGCLLVARFRRCHRPHPEGSIDDLLEDRPPPDDHRVVLLAASLLPVGADGRTGRWTDAVVVGMAQVFALLQASAVSG